MSGREILIGLEDSTFLANVDDRDRNVPRIVGAVLGGCAAGIVAAIIVTILLLIGYALANGGPGNFSQVLGDLIKADVHDLKTALFILLVPATSNGALALTAVAIAALVMRRRIKDYVTGAARIRWRLLLIGLVLCAVMMSPLIVSERLVDPKAPPMPLLTLSHSVAGQILYLLSAVALLIPAAAAEEIVFRGWFLRQTAAFKSGMLVLVAINALVLAFSPISLGGVDLIGALLRAMFGLSDNMFVDAFIRMLLGGGLTYLTIRQGGYQLALMLTNGLLFSAVHLDFQADSFLVRMIMGAGFTYMTLRLGGIEFSTGAHAANNILIVLFLEPLTLRPAISSGFSVLTFLEMAILALGSVAITEAVIRVPLLRKWSGLRDEELATPRAALTAESFA